MQIRQDPISKLYCRSDGAVLMPPGGIKYKTFRWMFGSTNSYGYKQVQFQRKVYKAHQIICRAFHGLPPEGRPCVDHINRARDDNRPNNLRWVSYKENSANQSSVDQSIAKFGVRHCDDKTAYTRAYSKTYYEAHRDERKAYGKAWYEAHCEEVKARNRAYSKAYRETHREEVKARDRVYSKAYRERHK